MKSLQAGHFLGLLIALLMAPATVVQAQLPEGVTVDWKTSSECTSPLDLEWQVARLLGPEVALEQPLAFLAEVGVRSGQYALTLRLTRGAQRLERKVELASCAEVQEAVALLVAITLDPKAALRARESAPERPAPKPLVIPPPPAAPSEPAARAAPRQRLLTGLTIAAIGDLQTLPGLTVAPAVGMELGLGRWRLALDARYFVPRYATSESLDVEARVELAAGSLGVAYVPDFGPIGLGPTLSTEIGYLRAVGMGGEDRRTTGTLWVAALGGMRLEYAVHARVSLRLAALAGVPLRKPQFALAPAPVFYKTPSITARIELGVLFRLGSRP